MLRIASRIRGVLICGEETSAQDLRLAFQPSPLLLCNGEADWMCRNRVTSITWEIAKGTNRQATGSGHWLAI